MEGGRTIASERKCSATANPTAVASVVGRITAELLSHLRRGLGTSHLGHHHGNAVTGPAKEAEMLRDSHSHTRAHLSVRRSRISLGHHQRDSVEGGSWSGRREDARLLGNSDPNSCHLHLPTWSNFDDFTSLKPRRRLETRIRPASSRFSFPVHNNKQHLFSSHPTSQIFAAPAVLITAKSPQRSLQHTIEIQLVRISSLHLPQSAVWLDCFSQWRTRTRTASLPTHRLSCQKRPLRHHTSHLPHHDADLRIAAARVHAHLTPL
jgi:hypothetical protein